MKAAQLTLRRFDRLDDDNNKEHDSDAVRGQGLLDTIVTGTGVRSGIGYRKGESEEPHTEDRDSRVGGSVTAATLMSRRSHQK